MCSILPIYGIIFCNLCWYLIKKKNHKYFQFTSDAREEMQRENDGTCVCTFI